MMYGSMVDIKFPTAEIRRGKKEEKETRKKKKIETTAAKYNNRMTRQLYERSLLFLLNVTIFITCPYLENIWKCK